jgi:hypothetical protein
MSYFVFLFPEFKLLCSNIRPVAQLVEHVTLNHGVESSILSGPTSSIDNFSRAGSWLRDILFPLAGISNILTYILKTLQNRLY